MVDNERDMKQRDLLNKYRETSQMKYLEELMADLDVFVKYVAQKYKTVQGIQRDDLYQAGRMGLIKGLERVDLDKDNAITTYLRYYIHLEMSQLIKKHIQQIKLEKSRKKNADYHDIDSYTNNILDDLMFHQSPESVFDVIETNEDTLKYLREGIKTLKPRDKKILYRLFYRESEDETTNIDVAKEFNISRARLYEIRKRILTKLGNYIKSRELN